MSKDLELIQEKLPNRSASVLQEYGKKSPSIAEGKLRFFSYGSNMNEQKFREDTKRCCYEFGLITAEKRTLAGFKRVLCNKSKNHGLAFSIHPSDKDNVEGICHDVPIEGLESFLKKEGVLLKEPTYELILVSISEEQQPVLTLVGLKPFSMERLNYERARKALEYVIASINGSKRWSVDYSDMLEAKNKLREMLGEV